MADREPDDIAPAPAKKGRPPADYRALAIEAIKLVLREGITRTQAATKVAEDAKASPGRYPACATLKRAILDTIANSAETAEIDKRDTTLTPAQRLDAIAARDALWTEAHRQLAQEEMPLKDAKSKEARLAQMYAAYPHVPPELAQAIKREIAEYRGWLNAFRKAYASILPSGITDSELFAAYVVVEKALIAHFESGTVTKTP